MRAARTLLFAFAIISGSASNASQPIAAIDVPADEADLVIALNQHFELMSDIGQKEVISREDHALARESLKQIPVDLYLSANGNHIKASEWHDSRDTSPWVVSMDSGRWALKPLGLQKKTNWWCLKATQYTCIIMEHKGGTMAKIDLRPYGHTERYINVFVDDEFHDIRYTDESFPAEINAAITRFRSDVLRSEEFPQIFVGDIVEFDGYIGEIGMERVIKESREIAPRVAIWPTRIEVLGEAEGFLNKVY